MNNNGDQKKGPVRKQTPTQLYNVQAKALSIKLYFQGYGFQAIADELRKSFGRAPANKSTLQDWIREEIGSLKDNRPDMVKNFKFVELEKINRLELEYWTAWERSVGVQVLIREEFEPVEAIPGKRGRKSKALIHGKLKKTIKETKSLTGEAKFLEGIRWAIDQRIKILGIEAPAKNDLGGSEADAGLQEAAADIQPATEGGPRKIVFKVVKAGQTGS